MPAVPPPKPAASEKSLRKNLTMREWARIEALWEEGDVTYQELVKRYGHSVSTYDRHFKAHGIVKGAKAHKAKARIAAELEQSMVDDATVMASRIRETKEDHYKMASALAKLTWNEILQAKKDGKPLGIALNNLKSLHNAMGILKAAREERYAVLGLDRPDHVDANTVPELVIAELTAEQVQALRDRDHTELDGAATHQEGPEGVQDSLDVVFEGEEPDDA